MDIAYIFFIALIALALGLGVVAYLSVALTSISSRFEKFEYWLPTFLVLMAGLVMLAGGLLNSRNLQFASLGASFIDADSSPVYLWLSRLTSLTLIGLTLPYFIAKALKQLGKSTQISWPLIIIIIFGISSFLLPGFLGLIPYFDHRALYPVITMVAVYLAAKLNPLGTLRAIKWTVVAFLLASLAFIVIDSPRVLAPSYKGWLPGIGSRFWGLAPHANAIGPMAALIVFIEILCPARHKIIRLGVFACAALVLVLAQSKTAIAATAVGLGFIFYMHMTHRASDASPNSFQLHKGHLLLLTFGIAGGAALLVLVNLGMIDRFLNRLDSIGVTSSVQSMSGRTVIWEAALREYMNNPIFGYGPSLWGDEYRRAIGLNYAYHAHNQVLQTMAMAGTTGLIGLVTFLALTMLRAFQTCRATGGVSVALLVLLGFRVMTEVPLSPVGIANGEMMAIAAVLCTWHLANKPAPSIRKSIIQ